MTLGSSKANLGLYRRRKLTDQVMTALMVACGVIAVVPLVLIITYVLKEGAGALSLDLFTQDPNPPTRPGGGFRSSLVGSGIIVGLAMAIGVPVAVGCGIFLAEYGQGRLGIVLRFLVDVLAGIPSIVMGLFIYGLIVVRQGHFSGFAGSLALAIIILPIVARITEEMMLLVPRSIREASLALGAPYWKTVTRIVLPTALPGIITGIVLGMSRIAGEAAPLLFTSLGNQFYTTDIFHTMDALPLRIYVFATGPYDFWHEQAWAMALVLVAIIFVISLGARALFGTRITVRQ
jgi:phosphate transport system permease protein